MPGCMEGLGMRAGPPMGPCLGPGIIMAGGMGRPAMPAPGICIPASRRCYKPHMYAIDGRPRTWAIHSMAMSTAAPLQAEAQHALLPMQPTRRAPNAY